MLQGLALVAVSLSPGDARACSAACEGAHLSPAAPVPSNAPGLVVTGWSAALVNPTDGGIVLRSEDGGIVAATVTALVPFRQMLITPSVPLQPDAGYFVELTDRCFPGDDAGIRQHSFRTTAAASLPATGGTASVTTRQDLISARTLSGACFVQIESAIADVVFVPSPELVPFLPVTAFTWAVDDGGFSAPLDFGALADGGAVYLLSLHGRCVRGPPRQYDDDGLALGHHTLTIGAEIAGSTQSLTRVPLEFTLGCDAGQPMAVDAGQPMAVDAGAVQDAGTLAPDGGTGPAMAGGCGCTSGSMGSAIFALLGLFVAHRRRATSRRRGPARRRAFHE